MQSKPSASQPDPDAIASIHPSRGTPLARGCRRSKSERGSSAFDAMGHARRQSSRSSANATWTVAFGIAVSPWAHPSAE